MIMGAEFSVADFFLWNEIPVLLGNLVGGLLLTGLPLYALYAKASQQR
jgi:formate/nitrite transporter FocA (FNT family)